MAATISPRPFSFFLTSPSPSLSTSSQNTTSFNFDHSQTPFPTLRSSHFISQSTSQLPELSHPQPPRPHSATGYSSMRLRRKIDPPSGDSQQRPSLADGSRNSSFSNVLKKKQSLASLLGKDATTPASAPRKDSKEFRPNPSSSRASSRARKTLSFVPRRLIDDDDEDATDRFVEKNRWRLNRHRMNLHPYARDAPYPVSYNHVSLESDRFTELLLQRINPTPSFHDYGNSPPASVLDLGCGQGSWAVATARAWPQSQIVGLDLMDVRIEEFYATSNVKLVRGNFVKFALPFAKKSFEYVRMANLSLSIPYDRWEFLLREVERVLTPGGRLEIIDDGFYFPYAQPPPTAHQRESTSSSPPTPPPRQRLGSAFFDSDEEEDFGTVLPTVHTEPETFDPYAGFGVAPHMHVDVSGKGKAKEEPIAPSISPPRKPMRSIPDVPEDVSDVSTPPRPRPRPEQTPPRPGETKPETPISLITPHHPSRAEQMDEFRQLEKTFEGMIFSQYGIHPRPCEFVVSAMQQVFGKKNAGKLKTLHLKLAPPEAAHGDTTDHSDSDHGHKRIWSRKPKKKENPAIKEKEKDVASRSSAENRSSGESARHTESAISAKAAGILGMTSAQKGKPKEKGQETASRPSEGHSSSESLRNVDGTISAKAAGLLGITTTPSSPAIVPLARTPSLSSSVSSHHRSSSVQQSPGLVLWPSTFIPMSPYELEMHACKYVHTLIGCKVALEEFVTGFKDEAGKELMGSNEFCELLWDYECFRRWRFNWPQAEVDPTESDQVFGPLHFMASRTPTPSKTMFGGRQEKSSLQNETPSFEEPYGEDELTHVRTIRVYEAVKSERPVLRRPQTSM